jgi:hypothetical protein
LPRLLPCDSSVATELYRQGSSSCKWLASQGCFLFDLFGRDRRQLMDDLMATHPDVQVSSIKGYLWNGLGEHIRLSQSVRHVELSG